MVQQSSPIPNRPFLIVVVRRVPPGLFLLATRLGRSSATLCALLLLSSWQGLSPRMSVLLCGPAALDPQPCGKVWPFDLVQKWRHSFNFVGVCLFRCFSTHPCMFGARPPGQPCSGNKLFCVEQVRLVLSSQCIRKLSRTESGVHASQTVLVSPTMCHVNHCIEVAYTTIPPCPALRFVVGAMRCKTTFEMLSLRLVTQITNVGLPGTQTLSTLLKLIRPATLISQRL